MGLKDTWSVAAVLIGLSSTALADDSLSVEAEVGFTSTAVDDLVGAFATRGRPYLGGRGELNMLFHTKGDFRAYLLDPRPGDAPMSFELSVSSTGPSILPITVDLHEVYWRTGPNEGPPMVVANTGAASVFNLLGTVKLGAGVSVIRSEGDAPTKYTGVYLGAEHRVRSKRLDTNVRATWTALPTHSEASLAQFNEWYTQGLMVDVDAMWKVEVGRITVGPRIDVAYRNVNLSGRDAMHELPAEFRAHVGAAVRWGGLSL